MFDWRKPTVQMLGRFQPWHTGHRALFERCLAKTGQVCIMVRDCQDWNDSNPFNVDEVIQNINQDLTDYAGKYTIIVVPNIVEIVYGRDVGYLISKIELPDEIQSISATKIREDMKNKGLL
jgi:nicotinamide mononucleotide adenylyltransferase